MTYRFLSFLLFPLLLLTAAPVASQDLSEEENDSSYGSGVGLEVLLTNNGFGLGAYYSRELGASTSFFLEASLGAGKDERELKFFSRFGDGLIPNKRNYLLMLPIQFGIQQRLFREQIEDNFRPYLQLTGGPTIGWEYPYFRDVNGNDRLDDFEDRYDVFTAFPKGAARFGMSGTVALGAYFGFSRRVTQGVRFGYAFTYFLDGIALLEPDVKEPQHLFRTPVISLTFGKLF